MGLATGTRLGPYEIVSAIGAGGMGEVYRAHDTSLGREVAIKVLPEAFAQDAERLERFEREAKTLAALNHPHIAQIYGLERAGRTPALVMELVDGEDLSQRIARGAIPVDEALQIAKQIADALEAAHEQGIIHRDLKPANIKVRIDGNVKVLDFGLAKLTESTRSATSDPALLSMSPTITSPPMTGVGVLLGTVAYMSPEQARGKPVDKRADIWAFGCVLYEMLCGKSAFGGENISDIIAGVLRAEPDWNALPPHTPRSVRALLRRCLQKETKQRLRDVGDAALQIDDALLPSELKQSHQPTRSRWVLAAAVLVVSALAGAGAMWAFRAERTRVSVGAYRTSLLPPAGMSFSPHDFAISPDGTRVAFVGLAPDGRNTLWVHSLDRRGSQQITDTDGASYPFWAPDSRRIGFFAAGQLKIADTSNSGAQSVAEAPNGRGGAWNSEGVIIFAPNIDGTLLRVSERGGRPQPATEVDAQGKAYYWPTFLPDQKHFLFFQQWGPVSDARPAGIYAGSLDGGKAVLISADVTGSVAFAAGYLLYLQDASLMAQPFDAERLSLSGQAVPILDQELNTDMAFRHGNFSVSSNGVVLFQSLTDSVTELIWYASDGKPLDRVPLSAPRGVELSDDGRFLAYASDQAGGKHYVSTYDIQRGVAMRLTDGGREDWPIWSRDGKALAYSEQDGDGKYSVDEIPAAGAGRPQRLLSGSFVQPNDYSPDGRSLIFMDTERGSPNLTVLDKAEQRSTLWNRGAEGQYSPDGKWLAFAFFRDVFVQAVESGTRIQISTSGGGQPRWRRDGKRLFYLAPDRKLMEVSIDVRSGELSAGVTRPLFQTHVVTPWFGGVQYDVNQDASRFIVNSLRPEAPLTLISGWPSLLRQ